MIESFVEVLLQKLAEASINVAIGVLAIIFALILGRRLRGLLAGAKTTLGPEGAKRLSDTSSLLLLTLALLIFLYSITNSLIFLVMFIGLIGVFAFSLTTFLSNVIAYYAIAAQGMLTKGVQVFLPDGAHGEVVDITPTHTLIKAPGGVYAVPNSKFLSSPALIFEEPTAVRLNIKLWNLDPHVSAQKVLETLSESLGVIVKDLSMNASAKPRTIVYEVGVDSLGVVVDIPLASGAGLERLGRLAERLRSSLKELSTSYSIIVEPLEGYKLRWKSVA